MYKAPSLTEIATHIKEDFTHYVSVQKQPLRDAIAKLCNDYEPLIEVNIDYEKIVTLTLLTLSVEAGLASTDLDQHYRHLTDGTRHRPYPYWS
ncbi:hypothetical protein IMZ31_22405 (plasmid) [Pontibacillus sp. ALD_SL1]|uniref:hypothetical protein n=1 Tax=Pontibacillus sp. ALD_SL1 TaxID=2777185 RepID=UPI001A964FAF|nr:hypothetical protein [Pontibacillus sp. ALD_SL1]QST02208.1 hypothetical protein IMZ31_22405 [Pontibacillus sp. ALD_SL1]